MAAARVFGQPDFSFSSFSNSGRDDNRMNGPRHLAVDRNNRLYVTDTGNHRVQIFDDVNQPRPIQGR